MLGVESILNAFDENKCNKTKENKTNKPTYIDEDFVKKAKSSTNKEIIKTNQKRAKTGMAPIDPDEDIYQQADIEYIKDGDYFLIRYERGDVKAWGAVKSH